MIRNQYINTFLSDIILFAETKAASQMRSADNSSIIHTISLYSHLHSDAMRPLLMTPARHSQSPRTPTSAQVCRLAAASLFDQGLSQAASPA
jgi:hypothetical protein